MTDQTVRQYLVEALIEYDNLVHWVERQLPESAWSATEDLLNGRIIDILREVTPEEREAWYRTFNQSRGCNNAAEFK